MKHGILPAAAAVTLISTFVGSANAAWEDHDSSVRQYDLGPPMLSNALQWVSTGCPDGIDYCGMLEFCEDTSDFPNVVFGYRHPCLDELEECECKAGPGPTIRLEPGNKYLLTLRNAAKNVASVTNLHTHGLHIVGAGNGDDVTRYVNGGGNCLDYVWDITDDHPGGTYWYHAHKHGFTEPQVNGGAYGMLIVEDNKIINPDTPEWATNEILLMVARINGEIYGNGNQDEIIRMDANQWYRLRVGVVDVLAEPDWLTFGSGCEIHQVAADGIWRSKVPGPAKSKFYLTGSSRADFAIRCASSFHVLFGGAKAATVYVGAVHPDPFEMEDWVPKRPRSLQGIAEAVVPPENTFDVELTREGINNILWDPTTPLTTVAYDEVHEWTLTRSKTHPFHLHLYHVLVVQPGGCGEQHEEGEFYDSISGNEYEECKVRFKASDVGQRCVLHCHVLNHEDNGAMGWVDVVGANMPRNDEVSPQYSCPATPRWTSAPTALVSPPTRRPTSSPGDVTASTTGGTSSDGILIQEDENCSPLGEKAVECGARPQDGRGETCCGGLTCGGDRGKVCVENMEDAFSTASSTTSSAPAVSVGFAFTLCLGVVASLSLYTL